MFPLWFLQMKVVNQEGAFVFLSEALRTDFVNEICRSNDGSWKQLRAVLGTRLT